MRQVVVVVLVGISCAVVSSMLTTLYREGTGALVGQTGSNRGRSEHNASLSPALAGLAASLGSVGASRQSASLPTALAGASLPTALAGLVAPLPGQPIMSDARCQKSCPSCTWSSTPSKPFDRKADRILMYGYGKTGTETLRTTFGNYTGKTVTYIDYDGHEQVLHKKSNHTPNAKKSNHKSRRLGSLPRSIKTHSRKVAKYALSTVPKGERLWIITGTRDPFSRSISAFFQGLKIRAYDWIGRNLSKTTVHDLMKHFPIEAAKRTYDHFIWPQRWFKDSFQDVVGFDLSACGGHFKDGSLYGELTLDGVHVSILLLRTEDSQQWEQTLGRFMPDLKMLRSTNRAIGRDVAGDLYQQFQQEWTWTEKDITFIKGFDTWQFYSKGFRDGVVQSLKREGV